MNLIPGEINKITSQTLLYESGDDVETICYIKKGTIVADNDKAPQTIGEGAIAGHMDIYGSFYNCDYLAGTDGEVIPIPADSPSTLVHYLGNNPAIHGTIAMAICNMLSDYRNMYSTLYGDIKKFFSEFNNLYFQYIMCCQEISAQPESFTMPKDCTLFEFNKLPFSNNYNLMSELAKTPDRAENVFKADREKFLKLQLFLINNFFNAYDNMKSYLQEMLSLFTGNNECCLFALAANLYKTAPNNKSIYDLLVRIKSAITEFEQSAKCHGETFLDIDYSRVDFFFMTVHIPNDTSDTSILDASVLDTSDDTSELSFSNDSCDEAPLDMPDFTHSLKQICEFAKLSSRYNEFDDYIKRFMSLTDKESRDDDLRLFRKKFTAAFYELYEEVFISYARNGQCNKLIELFLDFGFLDERLLSTSQLEFLCSIPQLNATKPCKIYRMKDWLMRIYNDKEIPSKNEFDMEYIDYVRDRKKNEGLSPNEERELLTSNELKTRFEIQNMLKYNCRLINGNLLSFFPMLHSENFDQSMDKLVLTSEQINEQIDALLKIDYSIFYREMLFAAPEKKIIKENIQKEIFPIIILFPVAGINGIMWQEISGKRSNSEGRIFLPAFFNGKLEETFLKLFGRYHWELCKTIQGASWNNIAIPSLTSEYCDYVQFYRKNKDLSSEKKEALKNQITRCRNNMREVFVSDYIIWMKYESSGSIRLNKIARRLLATYCPFTKDIRKKISSQPIFEEAMAMYEREKQKKIKELLLRFKALEKKGAEMTPELMATQRFYEEL